MGKKRKMEATVIAQLIECLPSMQSPQVMPRHCIKWAPIILALERWRKRITSSRSSLATW